MYTTNPKKYIYNSLYQSDSNKTSANYVQINSNYLIERKSLLSSDYTHPESFKIYKSSYSDRLPSTSRSIPFKELIKKWNTNI